MSTPMVRGVLAAVLMCSAGAAAALEFVREPSLFAHDTPDGLQDRYGLAVAIDGDTAAIAAAKRPGPPIGGGVVEIWVREGGAWRRQTTLQGPGRFGQSLALRGDVLLVGAPSAGDSQEPGQVIAYRRRGQAWAREGTLFGSGRGHGDAFGYAVAVQGDRALIGAPGKDGPAGADQGALYVFDFNGALWRESARLEAGARAGDLLGASVAWSGELALGGAVGVDSGQGAVHGFRSAGGAWSQAFVLHAADGEAGDTFGIAMAADAQRLVVGAHLDDVGGRVNAGSARVFARVGEGFAPEATLSSAETAGAALGYSVSLSGDVIVAGGSHAVPQVFRRGAAGWQSSAAPAAPSGDAVAAVAISGDTLAMGAPGTDVGQSQDRGVAAIAERVDGTWNTQVLSTSESFLGGTTFGYEIAIDAGRALIGGPGLCTGLCPLTLMPGAAYVFERGPSGALAHAQTLVGQPSRYTDGFGHAVAIRGDRALIASGGLFDWEYQPGLCVYERGAQGWQRAAELVDAQGKPVVASHVAIDGDIAVAGNRFDLHVFHRQASGRWRHEAKFPAGLEGAYVLSALALDGETLAAGMAGFSGEAPRQGVVYVLSRRDGRWGLDARLLGDSLPRAGFGAQLALDGGHLLVGEQGDREAGVGGGVLAYERSALGWQSRGRLALPSVDRYGAGLALHGEVAFAFAGQGAGQSSVFAFELHGGRWRSAGSLAADGPRLAFDGSTLLVSRFAADLDQSNEVEVFSIRR